MAYQCYMNVLLPFYLLSCVPFLSHAEINLPLRAVNLGNWLVTEGWMKPSRFQDIPNKDLLDGTQVQLKSIKLQRFLSSEKGGGTNLVANRPSASDWETFRLWRINESTFNLRVLKKQFVGLENQGQGKKIVAVSNSAGDSETFEIIRKSDDPYRVRIKAKNGLFLQAQSETLVTADYGGSGWEDANPSVFQMTIANKDNQLRGEYQITNGYGPDKAPQVMRDHWNTYITEEDFSFMSSSGLNAVRIPVGWWIRYDPTPPNPFVGGSLNALDNAFTWARKYKMKIIVDLHAVEGSQNGNDSGSRDGYQEWGDSKIQETVAVIDFLAKRYANNPSLAAIELINEPLAPGVTFDTLKKYYSAGYDAVRKYTSSACVILSNRLGPHVDPTEFLSFASGRTGVVIDVHYYSFFSDEFKTKNVQQNIDYIKNNRASDLARLTKPNGPLIFVGEWSCAWYVSGATMQDYQRFSKAQLDVYGRATFGWAFWSYKQGENVDSDEPRPWSLKWMIRHGYINLSGA